MFLKKFLKTMFFIHAIAALPALTFGEVMNSAVLAGEGLESVSPLNENEKNEEREEELVIEPQVALPIICQQTLGSPNAINQIAASSTTYHFTAMVSSWDEVDYLEPVWILPFKTKSVVLVRQSRHSEVTYRFAQELAQLVKGEVQFTVHSLEGRSLVSVLEIAATVTNGDGEKGAEQGSKSGESDRKVPSFETITPQYQELVMPAIYCERLPFFFGGGLETLPVAWPMGIDERIRNGVSAAETFL